MALLGMHRRIGNISYHQAMEIANLCQQIDVPKTFNNSFTKLIFMECATNGFDFGILMPTILASASLCLQRAFTFPQIDTDQTGVVVYASCCTNPTSGKDHVSEYVGSILEKVVANCRNLAIGTCPSIENVTHTMARSSSILVHCDNLATLFPRYNLDDITPEEEMLGRLYEAPEIFQYPHRNSFKTIHNPRLNLILDCAPQNMINILDLAHDDYYAVFHCFLISAPILRENKATNEPLEFSLLDILTNIHMVHVIPREYILTKDSLACLQRERDFWLRVEQEARHIDSTLHLICSNAYLKLKRLIIIVKSLNESANLVTTNTRFSSKANDKFSQVDYDENRVILPENFFIVTPQDIERGKALNDYFLKQQLFLSGFSIEHNNSIYTIIDRLLEHIIRTY